MKPKRDTAAKDSSTEKTKEQRQREIDREEQRLREQDARRAFELLVDDFRTVVRQYVPDAHRQNWLDQIEFRLTQISARPKRGRPTSEARDRRLVSFVELRIQARQAIPDLDETARAAREDWVPKSRREAIGEWARREHPKLSGDKLESLVDTLDKHYASIKKRVRGTT